MPADPYRSATDDDVVARLRKRVLETLDEDERYGLASPAAVADAEARLGFHLPRLLVRVWTDVGNGGFGPGSGIVGVPPNGYIDEDMGGDFVTLCCSQDGSAPKEFVPVCTWGCGIWSYIDCRDAAGPILTHEVLTDANGNTTIRYHLVCSSLREWLAKWVDGISLWDDMHEVVGHRTVMNPFRRRLENRPDQRLKGPVVFTGPLR